jgi:hypothetical protein
MRPISDGLRFFFALAILLYAIAATGAQDKGGPWIEFSGEAGYRVGSYAESDEDGGLAPVFQVRFGLERRGFGLIADLSANRDGKYAGALADVPGGSFFGVYFMLEEGGLSGKFGPLSLKAGRFRSYDILDSPYSLFFNSRGLATPQASIGYEDDFFFFETRWLELNNDSGQSTPGWPSQPNAENFSFNGFPDRGASVKTFGLKLGEMRVGFQDAATYSGRSFDFEYFLNPLPQYFIQYVKGYSSSRPWSTRADDGNILGFFWDWKRPGSFSLLAQVLVDDFGLGGFGGTSDNPWQAAFSLGGRMAMPEGSVGLYVAGATKYTFEPSEMEDGTHEAIMSEQNSVSYGYSYFPETRFSADWQDPAAIGTIGIEDNMIGYKYGQNNLAVQVDWQGEADRFLVGAAAEFRLMGANSPANPWHDLTNDPQDGTHWLDDALLEKRILLELRASRRVGDWSLGFSVTGGAALDALELRKPNVAAGPLVAPADSDIWFFEPVAGNHKPILTLKLGGSYRWRLR